MTELPRADGRWADRSGRTSALVVGSGAWGAFWGSWSALLPTVVAANAISPAALGLILTSVPVGAIPTMVLVGRAAVGREYRALCCAIVAMSAAVLMLALVTGPIALAIVLFAVGATSGAVDVCLNSATARHERETAAPHFHTVHAAFPVAVIAAAPITGFAVQQGIGARVVLIACAVLLGVTGLPLLRFGSRRPVTGPDAATGRSGPRARVRSRWLWGVALGVLGGCMLVVENAVEQWSVLLLEGTRGASPALASAAPSMYMAAVTGSRLAVRWAPRLGLRRLTVVAALGGGMGITVAALASNVAVSLLGYGITGLAYGPLMPALLSYAGARDETGYLVSVASAVSYGGFLVSPVFVGTLTRWVSLPFALASLAVMAVPLLVAALVASWRR